MSARPFADPQAAAGGSHAAAYGEVHYEPVALSDRIYDPRYRRDVRAEAVLNG